MNPLLKQLAALLESEQDIVANAANTSSFLFNNLEQVNWLGFYFLKDTVSKANSVDLIESKLGQDKQLVVGPFCGQPACTRIPIGQGVCGTAFAQQQTIIVDDVHDFDGHIACDAASQSELVVPFSIDGLAPLSGVLDIDSPITKRFGEDEKAFFEKAVEIYVNACSLNPKR